MSLSVSNTLTLRLYYGHFSKYVKSAEREDVSTGTLSFADSKALRTAIRQLQDYDFEEASESEIQEKVKAFADAMNYTLTSATEYGTTDTSVKNAANKIKTLNSEYADELEKIGITIEKDGTMSVYEEAASTYSSSRFTKFFDKDSEYLNSVYEAAKRITRRVDIAL